MPAAKLDDSEGKRQVRAARGLGRSCRAAFYGFAGWQMAGLNALKTDDSEGDCEGRWQA